MKELEKQKEALMHKSFTMMFRVALIFGLPAAAAFFVGRYLDTTYSIRPWGSVGVLAVTFLGSWIAVIKMYLKLDKELREFRQKEDEAEEQEKKELEIKS